MANSVFRWTRTSLGLTQRQVAESIGVSVRSVTDWESGKPDAKGKAPRPSWETCERLAPLLDSSAEVIANSFGLPSPQQKAQFEADLRAGRLAEAEAPPPTAFVSLERLYHYRCGVCGAWWSVADRAPKEFVYCPDCGARQRVGRVVDGSGDVVLEI